MTRLIDTNLHNLSASMSEMGDLSIQGLEYAINSYLKGTNPIIEVRQISENITNMYHKVGDLIFTTMLKFQPMASDFRFIRSAIEISYAFHRFGRYAYDITLVRDKFGDISSCNNKWLYQVSNETLQMTKDALHSFALLDDSKFNMIKINEEYVDKLCKERFSMLATQETNTKCVLAEALLLGYLERVADHAMHMSRTVSYIISGKRQPE